MPPPNYAVFGQPISHSLSPRIHAAFGRQTGTALRYVAIETPAESFAATLARFADEGGRGANITLPLKQDAFRASAQTSDFARRAGAVNTLSRVDDAWHGDNTDGPGLIRDLTERHSLDLRARRTLLLGAGGAARAAAHALLDAGIGELVIVNRNAERADALADSVRDPERVHTRYWHDLGDLGSFDLIVNATSAGVGGSRLELPFGLVAPRALCYDLSYGAAAFGFVAWARAAGAGQALDGLGMLIEQAAESFSIWHGTRPETDPVYAELRGELPLRATD
ncbi:MAG: shikimate dehydrogenase [Rudaea sp.]|uniref:shikimate dehydrogenase n=1 Tax=unclassified Rudaea TaxID=2627037 RepID=UPI0010F5503A|nr:MULTISPECIES: shikimate dehydrogenase [unclassified Rudaea]MBN8886130.1 shikimate dehydrogenase [Rudaea sp.]